MQSQIRSTYPPEKIACKPLIKWPGGKRLLAHAILKLIPPKFGTYYEPFIGGGAVFFALQPNKAVLSDANAELINAYEQIRDNAEKLVDALRAFKNTEQDYYAVRAMLPKLPIRKAARFLYLNRLSFNGIHRVNSRGEFNVPYGKRQHLSVFDEELLFRTASVLKKAVLKNGDFEHMTRKAGKGDVVYFDPPYTVAHGKNGFLKYNENIFSWHDQQRLALHAKVLAGRGCRVIVSNADHVSIRQLYSDFHCQIVERPSVIAAISKHRGVVTECVFTMG
jgi:DNA adenine methylase